MRSWNCFDWHVFRDIWRWLTHPILVFSLGMVHGWGLVVGPRFRPSCRLICSIACVIMIAVAVMLICFCIFCQPLSSYPHPHRNCEVIGVAQGVQENGWTFHFHALLIGSKSSYWMFFTFFGIARIWDIVSFFCLVSGSLVPYSDVKDCAEQKIYF